MEQMEQIVWRPVSAGVPDKPKVTRYPHYFLYTNTGGNVGACCWDLLDGSAKSGEIIAWAQMPRGYDPGKEQS